jgi:hypothetical protein
VKSGFKIAGAILTSFAAITLFIVGDVDVTTPEKQHVALASVYEIGPTISAVV